MDAHGLEDGDQVGGVFGEQLGRFVADVGDDRFDLPAAQPSREPGLGEGGHVGGAATGFDETEGVAGGDAVVAEPGDGGGLVVELPQRVAIEGGDAEGELGFELVAHPEHGGQIVAISRRLELTNCFRQRPPTHALMIPRPRPPDRQKLKKIRYFWRAGGNSWTFERVRV